MKLILATNNKGKVREYKEILSPLGFEPVSLAEAGINVDTEETGTTFKENSYIKAKAIFDMTHTAVIADDSGLCVDALDGAPGVYSARYAEEGKRCEKLLSALSDVPEDKRTARFICSICMIDSSGEVIYAEGKCEGRIAFEEKGSNGFGYDPVFLYGERTLAEMTEDEKNAVSHRANAVKELVKIISKQDIK